MISHTTKSFRKALATLPDAIRRQAREAYQQFKRDPHYPSLQFKCIHAVKPIYSARITIDYRAVGILSGDEIVWFWIGSHADYDKLIQQL